MRATHRRWNDVPILAVTNNDSRWTDTDYRHAGFAGMFPKPIQPSRLFRTIDDILLEGHQPPLLDPAGNDFSNAQVA